MSVQEFYAEPHLDTADGFGSTLAPRKTPHRGLDVNGWPEGTPIPTYCPGTVERVYQSVSLGNVVVVRSAFGWVGYCHLLSASVQVGQQLAANDIVGLLGNTGSASVGAHLHTTVSLTGNDPGTSPVVDPLPYIRQYRDAEPNPEDDMKSQYFVALSPSPSGLVVKDSVWVRPAPGMPLAPLTSGQAHDWFKMDGLDFNAPNVFGKPGEWFDLAFAEDNQMLALYAHAHPVNSVAFSTAALEAAVKKALQGTYKVEKI